MASKSKKLGMAADIFGDSIEGAIRKIKISDITPDQSQPRKNKDINISLLAKSLKEEGLLQPIVVTKENTGYSIIAGERRFRAASSLGWKEIECRIINKSGKDKFRLAVVENLQRENLNPVEEALAFQRLKKTFAYTDNDLANIIGKSRNYISEILSIAEISASWLQKAENAQLQSKNLLIQFAQAIKINKGDDFLQSYQRGELNTVKDAKNYIQIAKGNTKEQAESVKPPENKSQKKTQNDNIHTKEDEENFVQNFPEQSTPKEEKNNLPKKYPTIQIQQISDSAFSVLVENNQNISDSTVEAIEQFLKESLKKFF